MRFNRQRRAGGLSRKGEKMKGTSRMDAEYLRIMGDMMDNPAVWEIIKDRSPEGKDAFLRDRFDAACKKAFAYRHDFNEWHEAAKRFGIEPILAQTAWELLPPLVIITDPPKLSWPCHEGKPCTCGATDK